jgi:hypothetical protein
MQLQYSIQKAKFQNIEASDAHFQTSTGIRDG